MSDNTPFFFCSVWHDHGTILGLGCVIITVHIAYDPAVFYTQAEYEDKHGKSSIQTLIERPVMHLMAAGTSAVDDQLALLQDRIDYLNDLSTNLSFLSEITLHNNFSPHTAPNRIFCPPPLIPLPTSPTTCETW